MAGEAALKSQRRARLRLIVENTTMDLPERFNDPAFRKEFQQLTEQLIDALIEMVDIIDGDPDVELNGDEFEEDTAII